MTWLEAVRVVWREFRFQPPVWGITDCCKFAARYVELRTGKDFSAEFDYDTKVSALRILAEHGGLVGLITHCLGSPKTEPTPGDLVVANIARKGEMLTTGIYNGYYVIGIHPDEGPGLFASRLIVATWSL